MTLVKTVLNRTTFISKMMDEGVTFYSGVASNGEPVGKWYKFKPNRGFIEGNVGSDLNAPLTFFDFSFLYVKENWWDNLPAEGWLCELKGENSFFNVSPDRIENGKFAGIYDLDSLEPIRADDSRIKYCGNVTVWHHSGDVPEVRLYGGKNNMTLLSQPYCVPPELMGTAASMAAKRRENSGERIGNPVSNGGMNKPKC